MIVVSIALLMVAVPLTMTGETDADLTSSGAGAITIYVEGTEEDTFYTMYDALNFVNDVPLDDEVTMNCEAGKPIVFGGSHIDLQRSLTINGNNAFAVKSLTEESAQVDFAIDEYEDLKGDTTLIINDFHNSGVWGTRKTTHDFTLTMNNCDSGSTEITSGYRVYINGFTGNNYITLNDCDFGPNSNSCTVYSNANGSLNINRCTFSNISEPININSTSDVNVNMSISIRDCVFTDCGLGAVNVDDSEWAAPIRIVSTGDNGGSTSVVVDSCSFNYNDEESLNGDILIGNGRSSATTSNPISLAVTNTNAEIQIQQPGYHSDKEPSYVDIAMVSASEKLTASGTVITITDNTPEIEPTPVPDDESVPPFIPSGSSSSDDTTYLIAACAAAAVVVLLAVVLVMMERKK